MRAPGAIALVCALAPLTTSCFAIGLVVGGSTPREETLTPSRDAPFTAESPDLPEFGQDVEIELRSGAVVAGEYRGVQYGAFAVQTAQGLRPAPLSEVRAIRVVRGSHAAAGFAIGLGADWLAISVLSRVGTMK